MTQKPGWTYSYCNSLEQNIAINNQTGVLYTEDKTRYSEQECQLLKKIKLEIPKSVHIIKKVFGGTILTI